MSEEKKRKSLIEVILPLAGGGAARLQEWERTQELHCPNPACSVSRVYKHMNELQLHHTQYACVNCGTFIELSNRPGGVETECGLAKATVIDVSTRTIYVVFPRSNGACSTIVFTMLREAGWTPEELTDNTESVTVMKGTKTPADDDDVCCMMQLITDAIDTLLYVGGKLDDCEDAVRKYVGSSRGNREPVAA